MTSDKKNNKKQLPATEAKHAYTSIKYQQMTIELYYVKRKTRALTKDTQDYSVVQ